MKGQGFAGACPCEMVMWAWWFSSGGRWQLSSTMYAEGIPSKTTLSACLDQVRQWQE